MRVRTALTIGLALAGILGAPRLLLAQCVGESAALVGSEVEDGSFNGWAVGIDGDRAVVTDRSYWMGSVQTGAAYVFERDGLGGWNEVAFLVSDEPVDLDEFGESAAIAGDVIVVGSPSDCADPGVGCLRTGAVHVYRFDGSAWSLEQELFAADGADGDFFGEEVSACGDLIAVAAPGDDPLQSVYVYRFDGASWVQEQKIVSPGTYPAQQFGRSISVWGDKLLVGGLQQPSVPPVNGVAYLYRDDPGLGMWVLESTLTPPDTTVDHDFGGSVAIGVDLAAVGASEDDTLGADAGAAYLYREGNTIWDFEEKLLSAEGEAGDRFGASVAVRGESVVVGAPQNLGGSPGSGMAYLYRENGEQWFETALLPGGLISGHVFGFSVAIEEGRAVVGSLLDGGHGTAYVFDFDAEFLRGDCNQDSLLDIADGIWILSQLYTGGEVSTCLDACDTDDDGSLGMGDAIYIFDYRIGSAGGPPPPAPFPLTGADSTPDALGCGDVSPCD